MILDPAVTVRVKDIVAQVDRCHLLYGPDFGSWAKWFVQHVVRLNAGEQEKLKELMG